VRRVLPGQGVQPHKPCRTERMCEIVKQSKQHVTQLTLGARECGSNMHDFLVGYRVLPNLREADLYRAGSLHS